MGFVITTFIFVMTGIIASIGARLCCYKGPSTNLLLLTLIMTATVCCWMMWAIVYVAQMKPLIVPILSEGDVIQSLGLSLVYKRNWLGKVESWRSSVYKRNRLGKVESWPSSVYKRNRLGKVESWPRPVYKRNLMVKQSQ
ncbi:hypothetical protein ACFE04_007436 [Oxalis oulophora]